MNCLYPNTIQRSDLTIDISDEEKTSVWIGVVEDNQGLHLPEDLLQLLCFPTNADRMG